MMNVHPEESIAATRLACAEREDAMGAGQPIVEDGIITHFTGLSPQPP